MQADTLQALEQSLKLWQPLLEARLILKQASHHTSGTRRVRSQDGIRSLELPWQSEVENSAVGWVVGGHSSQILRFLEIYQSWEIGRSEKISLPCLLIRTPAIVLLFCMIHLPLLVLIACSCILSSIFPTDGFFWFFTYIHMDSRCNIAW